MVIACYCRVSSKKQKLENQKYAIIDYLVKKGIPPTKVAWYEDVCSTRKTCPDLERLKKDIRIDRVTHVIVWKIDRLSRQIDEGKELIFGWLEKGIKISSISENIECDGPARSQTLEIVELLKLGDGNDSRILLPYPPQTFV